MKKLLIILITVIGFIGGYILGSYYPFQGLLPEKSDIATPTSEQLTITVINQDNQPMVGIEIDVAQQPGLPESWGVKEADTSGKAIYNLEPGTYFVFFNTNRFPQGYVVPREQEINIEKGKPQEIIITLEKSN